MIDESVPSLHFGDVCTEAVLASHERPSEVVADELNTLMNGLQAGRVPPLCKSHSRVCLVAVTAAQLAEKQDGDEDDYNTAACHRKLPAEFVKRTMQGTVRTFSGFMMCGNKQNYWRPRQMVGASGASEATAPTHIQ